MNKHALRILLGTASEEEIAHVHSLVKEIWKDKVFTLPTEPVRAAEWLLTHQAQHKGRSRYRNRAHLESKLIGSTPLKFPDDDSKLQLY